MALFNKNKNSENVNEEKKETVNKAENEGIKTELVFHPEWNLNVQEKYVFQFNHQKLPLLQPNQVSINGINIYKFDDGFVVTAFLSSTLPKPLSFEVIDLAIVNEKNETLARKSFEMDLFGDLPPNSSIPWRFLFDKEDQLVEEIPDKDWRLVFELKQKVHQSLPLDLEENWRQALSEEQIANLENIVKSLPPVKVGEVNFLGLEAAQREDKSIAITLLLRNGSEKDLTFENLPLTLIDASGEMVAKAGFPIGHVNFKARTCKPYSLTFPAEAIIKEHVDLSKWQVTLTQQN